MQGFELGSLVLGIFYPEGFREDTVMEFFLFYLLKVLHVEHAPLFTPLFGLLFNFLSLFIVC